MASSHGSGVRIGCELLEAERDALLLLVELQHLHLDLIAHVDQVARMRQAAPAHVGDVQQAVEPAEVDECAVVGQVLHRARQDGALFERAERLFTLAGLLFFEDLFARDDDIAALLVQLDDAHVDRLADIGVQIANGDGSPPAIRAGTP